MKKILRNLFFYVKSLWSAWIKALNTLWYYKLGDIMERIKSNRFTHRILLGSVLFGLFFGAGNLIFPVNVGQLAGNNMNIATLGFSITAVLLPVLGVIFCATSESETLESLLVGFGKKYARFFNTVLLLTIGPFFALPRTATVPYEVGVSHLFPNINQKLGLFIYTLIFFAIALNMALRPGKVKEIIGKFINPLFLTCLFLFFVLFFVKTMGPIDPIVPDPAYGERAFITSFVYGYQTMDLLAALVFTYVVISVNDFSSDGNKRSAVLDLVYAGIFAGIMLMAIYYVLTVIAVSSRNIFDTAANGGIALGQIFNHYLGKLGTAFFVITITLACIKTATGLTIACANYFHSLFPKINYRQFVFIFITAGVFVANIGLTAIIYFAVPVLNFIYPLAIMHVIYGLIFKHENIVRNKYVLYFTMIGAILELIASFPNLIASSNLLTNTLALYHNLPLARFGIEWVNFTIIGLIIGSLISRIKSK